MKHIMTAIAILVSAILATPNLFGAARPEQIPLGPNGIIELLSMAKKAMVECSAPSQIKEFRETVELGEFKSIGDVEAILNQIEVNISVQNPKDQIRLSANLEDENGTALFRADTYFSFERVGYDSLGRPRYLLPQWVGYLYFTASDISFEFYGAREAIVFGQRGEEYALDISGDEITIPGWMQGGQYSYLLIRDHLGIEHFYDFNTGCRMMSATDNIDIFEVGFQNITSAEPDSEGNLYVWTAPEWGYCPWVEISKGGRLYSQTEYGFRPKFVRIVTLAGRKAGEQDQVLDYSEGMYLEVEEGETVFLLFEFEEWIYSSGDWGGKG